MISDGAAYFDAMAVDAALRGELQELFLLGVDGGIKRDFAERQSLNDQVCKGAALKAHMSNNCRWRLNSVSHAHARGQLLCCPPDPRFGKPAISGRKP